MTFERLQQILYSVYDAGYTDRDKFYGYNPRTSQEYRDALKELQDLLKEDT